MLTNDLWSTIGHGSRSSKRFGTIGLVRAACTLVPCLVSFALRRKLSLAVNITTMPSISIFIALPTILFLPMVQPEKHPVRLLLLPVAPMVYHISSSDACGPWRCAYRYLRSFGGLSSVLVFRRVRFDVNLLTVRTGRTLCCLVFYSPSSHSLFSG
jgi:hypothetical protein